MQLFQHQDDPHKPHERTQTGSQRSLCGLAADLRRQGHQWRGSVPDVVDAVVGETWTYNSNGQLTQLTGLNGVNLKYYAAAGSNNGQIASQQDLVSGVTIGVCV